MPDLCKAFPPSIRGRDCPSFCERTALASGNKKPTKGGLRESPTAIAFRSRSHQPRGLFQGDSIPKILLSPPGAVLKNYCLTPVMISRNTAIPKWPSFEADTGLLPALNEEGWSPRYCHRADDSCRRSSR